MIKLLCNILNRIRTKLFYNQKQPTMQFYDIKARTIQGDNIFMSEYKGKVVVVVNTASQCGLTPQLEGLEQLYRKYKDKGLIVLGFPCNQFAKQEPGNSTQIQEFCQLNYGVTFQMFEKIEVNGENTHPIFKYLKSKKRGWLGESIKWNFTKFIIDRNGNPLKRCSPTTKPQHMEKMIRELLEVRE